MDTILSNYTDLNLRRSHERLQLQYQAHSVAFLDISTLNMITATQQIPEGTLCCHHVLTACWNHSVGRLLSGFELLLPVWLNCFELCGNATVRCNPCRSSFWGFCYTFALTDQDRKNIWKNQVSFFFFFSNQESWQAR